jgi:hypothetical protein
MKSEGWQVVDAYFASSSIASFLSNQVFAFAGSDQQTGFLLPDCMDFDSKFPKTIFPQANCLRPLYADRLLGPSASQDVFDSFQDRNLR